RERFMRIDKPVWRHNFGKRFTSKLSSETVAGVFRHLRDQPSFKKFYRIIVGEYACLNHVMILGNAQPPDGDARYHQRFFKRKRDRHAFVPCFTHHECLNDTTGKAATS